MMTVLCCRVYVCSIIVPLICITYVNVLGGILHPSSGERVSLSVTMLLTGAAVFHVAIDSMPKIGNATFISRLYLTSLIHNLVALMETFIVVSLHHICDYDYGSYESEDHCGVARGNIC